MDETYIRKRVSQVYSHSYGGGMIDKFTALMVELLKEEAAQQHAHPDGKWKCRACKSVWDGSQLVLDPMSTEVKWTCGDYFCGGSCDRIVIGE